MKDGNHFGVVSNALKMLRMQTVEYGASGILFQPGCLLVFELLPDCLGLVEFI